jgi:hypothetical protein
MMLPVLLDSALRSSFLGCAVWIVLKISRLRDSGAETALWAVVLIAALSMPLLSGHLPGIVLNLPLVSGWGTDASTLGLASALVSAPTHGGMALWPSPKWHPYYGWTCFTAAYLVGFGVCSIRLLTGLLLTFRLYRRSTPVQAPWVQARRIRIAPDMKSPVSLGRTILLPADHGDWSAAKRNAVLAHEDAHIARGDFFLQLAALIHCTVFWFSPFAWWLQTKLAEIAETASDEAAIRRLQDPAEYAEILVDVSRRAQRSPLIVAMAKSSFIQQRIEHILSESPTRTLSPALRALSVTLLAMLAIAVAGAKTETHPIGADEKRTAGAVSKDPGTSGSRTHAAGRGATGVARIAAGPGGSRGVSNPKPSTVHASSATPAPAGTTYNPRALLDPVYRRKPDYLAAATVVHDGTEFYVRSTERPVADLFVTYATERQIH